MWYYQLQSSSGIQNHTIYIPFYTYVGKKSIWKELCIDNNVYYHFNLADDYHMPLHN